MYRANLKRNRLIHHLQTRSSLKSRVSSSLLMQCKSDVLIVAGNKACKGPIRLPRQHVTFDFQGGSSYAIADKTSGISRRLEYKLTLQPAAGVAVTFLLSPSAPIVWTRAYGMESNADRLLPPYHMRMNISLMYDNHKLSLCSLLRAL